MTIAEIQHRLTLLEKEVARLKLPRTTAPARLTPAQVLESIHGKFEDDEAFREAMRLGRKWRDSLDAKPQAKRKTRRK